MNWSEADIALLRKKYPLLPTREVAALLSRSYAQVKTKASVLGLYKTKYYWTDAQVERLKALWPDTPTPEVAKKLKRRYYSVVQKAFKLRLKKSEAYRERMLAKWTKDGEATRLGPTHKSYRWNAGMKGLKFPGSEKGWFKPGQLPHNTKYDGAVAIRFHHSGRHGVKRPIKHIRLAQGKWKPLHIHIWEHYNGPVPKGMLVSFIDANSLNCCVGNLHLITRQQHIANTRELDEYIARTLSIRGKFGIDRPLYNELLKHPEILDLKRKQLQLRKALHEKEQQL